MNHFMKTDIFKTVCASAGISFWSWDVPGDSIAFHNLQHFSDNENESGGETTLSLGEWEKLVEKADLAAMRKAIRRCFAGLSDMYEVTVRVHRSGTTLWVLDRGWVIKRQENGRPLRLVGLKQDVTRIKALEQDLYRKQSFLDIVFDISGLVPWEMDCITGKAVFGEQFTREYGYSAPKDIARLQTDCFSIIHPEDRGDALMALDAFLKGATANYRKEMRIQHENGTYLWALISGCATERNNGVPLHLVGGLLNIDGLKKAEEALSNALKENQSSNYHLQQEIASAQESLLLSRKDLYRHSDLLKVVTCVATDLLITTDAKIHLAIKKALQQIGRTIHADRVYLMKNYTHNKEHCLRPLYHWLEGSDAGSLKGNKHVFSYANFKSWEAKLARGESINTHVQNLPKPQSRFFMAHGVQSLLLLPIHLGEEFWGVIYFGASRRVRLADDAELKTLTSSATLLVLSHIRNDVVKKLNKAIKAAKASNQARTVLLANMSHEMKTPMNAIMGLTTLAIKKPDNTVKYLEKIHHAAQKLMALINDLLLMADISSNSFTLTERPLCVKAVMDHVYESHRAEAEAKRQHFAVDSNALSSHVFQGDATRLELIISGLVSNAVKFTPEGGTITVTARETPRNDAISEFSISIQDTGIGIAKKDIPGLFRPFEQREGKLTRSFEGAGLGLTIARRIIKKMNGDIHVESTPGKGSTFTASLRLKRAEALPKQPDSSLPVKNAAPAPCSLAPSVQLANALENAFSCEVAATQQKADYTGKRILVVDDNPINREILQSLLEDAGARVHCVENGLEAYQAVQKEPGLHDAVLMDIHMPVLDGYQATEKIRSLPSTVPIIAVTANAFARDVEKCKRSGMNDHLGKPINPDLLFQILDQYLRYDGASA